MICLSLRFCYATLKKLKFILVVHEMKLLQNKECLLCYKLLYLINVDTDESELSSSSTPESCHLSDLLTRKIGF